MLTLWKVVYRFLRWKPVSWWRRGRDDGRTRASVPVSWGVRQQSSGDAEGTPGRRLRQDGDDSRTPALLGPDPAQAPPVNTPVYMSWCSECGRTWTGNAPMISLLGCDHLQVSTRLQNPVALERVF